MPPNDSPFFSGKLSDWGTAKQDQEDPNNVVRRGWQHRAGNGILLPARVEPNMVLTATSRKFVIIIFLCAKR